MQPSSNTRTVIKTFGESGCLLLSLFLINVIWPLRGHPRARTISCVHLQLEMLLGIRTHLSLSISVTGSTLLLGENWALMQSKWNNKQREEDRDAAVEKMKCAADNFHLAALQWETGPHIAQFNLQRFQRPVWCQSDYSNATKYPTTTTTMHKLLLLQGSELNTTALHQMKWLIMRLLQLGEYYRQTHKNTTSLVKISLRLTSIFSVTRRSRSGVCQWVSESVSQSL